MNTIFHTPDDQKLLLSTLRMLGVTKVVVEFSGSGDSGNIDAVHATNEREDVIDLTTTSIPWNKVRGETSYVAGSFSWATKVTPEVMTVEKVIESLCELALDQSQLDWYNNDGGQGHFTIDLSQEAPSIALDVGINYMQTEDHSFEFYGPITEEDANAPLSP